MTKRRTTAPGLFCAERVRFEPCSLPETLRVPALYCISSPSYLGYYSLCVHRWQIKIKGKPPLQHWISLIQLRILQAWFFSPRESIIIYEECFSKTGSPGFSNKTQIL